MAEKRTKARDANDTPVTFDDYWDATSVTWHVVEELPVNAIPFRDAWLTMAKIWMEKYAGLGERKRSPCYCSRSQYILDRTNGYIYRFSDHWNAVASCRWPLNKELDYSICIARARISDFKRIPKGSIHK